MFIITRVSYLAAVNMHKRTDLFFSKRQIIRTKSKATKREELISRTLTHLKCLVPVLCVRLFVSNL